MSSFVLENDSISMKPNRPETKAEDNPPVNVQMGIKARATTIQPKPIKHVGLKEEVGLK